MNVDAFILAGGRSRRMGQNKATLQIGGLTLVERAAATIRGALSPQNVGLVVADKATHTLGLPVTCDIYPGNGAVGALHAALSAADSEWILVLACDLPMVSPNLIRRLAEYIGDACDSVVPVQADGRLQPLCAFYRVQACFKPIEDILRQSAPTPALASIVEQLRPRLAQFDEISDLPRSEHFFLNVNTPEDLERARRLCVPAV